MSTTPAPQAASAAFGPTVLQPGTGKLLTVGAGMEFATLSDALKASADGDTIAVQAGTYTNDFGTVTHDVRIVAVGGIVNEVATVPPPDDKGLLTVDDNLSIQGFTFTGGSDGSPDGNVAGIRLESGNLNVAYCDFHDMQEGLLADADATASVTIDHSEFAHNGTGDGLTHNLYIGAIASLTVTNSYFHDAVVGHELKSRAAVTTIENNVIADGPTGTASYDIDIPNAGVATITGNIIEKGPDASNWPAIHYGGETQFVWPKNALTISGNTIVNDYGANAIVLLNQSEATGLSVTGTVTHNVLYGFAPGQLAQGLAALSGNTVPTTRPTVAAPVTWQAMPKVSIAAGAEVLALSNSGHTVGGGTAHLQLTDTAGSNTISGGSGGITAALPGGWDQVSTKAGASDQLTLSGRNCVLHSAGNDHITASGFYEDVYATGASTITSAGFNSIYLDGAGELLTATAGCNLSVGAAGNARVVDQGTDLALTEAAGGQLTISDQPTGGTPTGATVAGALTGSIGHGGAVSLAASAASGILVRAGGGSVSVTGGAGADTLNAGTGSAVFVLGGGADQVVFGKGATSVTGGTGRDTYHFHHGDGGHDTIAGFKPGTDVLSFEGYTGNAVASGSVAGGNTTLTLTDGTTVLFTGVALPGYSAPPTSPPTPTPPTPTPPVTPPTAPPPPPAGGSGGTLVLTTGGQSVTGGASLLTVTDQVGGNTIAGGPGGLDATAGWSDVVTTQAGSTNQLVLTRDDTLAGAGADQVSVASTGDHVTEAGAATVALGSTGAVVQGGAGRLGVTDTVGGNTVVGGSGGLTAALGGWYDSVATAGGASDMITVSGYSIVTSGGQDQVAVHGLYDQVTATGAASIASDSLFSGFDLEGSDTLSAAGGLVTVGGAASATVSATGANDLSLTKQAGGSLLIGTALPTGPASLDLVGGAATVLAAAGTYARLAATTSGGVGVTAGTGVTSVVSQAVAGGPGDTISGGSGLLTVTSGAAGVLMLAGSGNVTLNGGAGNDAFVGGSGAAVLNLGGGADTVTLGGGDVTVNGGGGADTFVVPPDAAGTLVVANWSSQDSLVAPGGGQPAVLADSVSGGSTWLTLAGGSQVELVGVTHFGG